MAGMTGTAATEADEFYKIYGLEVAVIPTNLEMVREDEADLVFQAAEVQVECAVVEDIVRNPRDGPAHPGGHHVHRGLRSLE